MTGADRRQQIIKTIEQAKKPVPAKNLAADFAVSRQVIVQDIALIRSGDHDVVAIDTISACHECRRIELEQFAINCLDVMGRNLHQTNAKDDQRSRYVNENIFDILDVIDEAI